VSRPAPACLLAVLWLGASDPARADSAQDVFRQARLEFEYKSFTRTVELLRPLLEPAVLLTSEADIAAAREMLGLAYFYLDDEGRAREELTELLYLRPQHRLDPFLVPPPAVRFFEDIRSAPALKEKLEQIERERQEALEAERRRKESLAGVRRIYLERTTTEHWWVLNLLPFGIPQFQNGHRTKGITLAVLGGVSLLVNVMSGLVVWGLAGDDLRFSRGEADLARGFQIAQYASLGVFGGLWIYGVADGLYFYQPSVVEPFQRVGDELEFPGQDGAGDEAEPSAAPAAPGLQGLFPLAVPGGAGLGWRFRF
jgi:hypothetical protein